MEVQDHDTCGLLLSECMRSFMKKHNDQDPGLLGLKILEDGRDLDLGADVIDSIKVGETVLGVSYTVHRTDQAKVDKKSKDTLRGARKFGSPKPPSPKSKKKRSGSLTWMLRKVGLASSQDDDEGDKGSTVGFREKVIESDTSTTLKRGSSPSPSKNIETETSSKNSMFGRSLAFLTGKSSTDQKNQPKSKRTMFGKEIHHIFTPLTHVSLDVEKQAVEDRRLVRQGRLGVGELAATSVKRFLCSVVKDPSSDLPAAVTLVLGNSRLSLADDDDEGVDHHFEWKYDDVHSYGDNGKYLFLNIVVPKNSENATEVENEKGTYVWHFEFEIGDKKVLTRDFIDALSSRCIEISNMRSRAQHHQKSLNNLLPKNYADHHLKSFQVTRHEDPTGLLGKRCLVYISTFGVSFVLCFYFSLCKDTNRHTHTHTHTHYHRRYATCHHCRFCYKRRSMRLAIYDDIFVEN